MPESFFESALCRGRHHCSACREWHEAGQQWRQEIARTYDTGGVANFDCPFGENWIHRPEGAPPEAAPPSVTTTERPRPTPKQAVTFVAALWGGKYAPAEVVAERMEICHQCEFWRINAEKVEWCGQCGCKVAATNRELTNLAAYEERLPKWGCKHPQRAQGKGWKR